MGLLTVLVVVVHNSAIEHYLFRLDKQGNGEVVWGTVRAQGLLPKSSLFRAACQRFSG